MQTFTLLLNYIDVYMIHTHTYIVKQIILNVTINVIRFNSAYKNQSVICCITWSVVLSYFRFFAGLDDDADLGAATGVELDVVLQLEGGLEIDSPTSSSSSSLELDITVASALLVVPFFFA